MSAAAVLSDGGGGAAGSGKGEGEEVVRVLVEFRCVFFSFLSLRSLRSLCFVDFFLPFSTFLRCWWWCCIEMLLVHISGRL